MVQPTPILSLQQYYEVGYLSKNDWLKVTQNAGSPMSQNSFCIIHKKIQGTRAKSSMSYPEARDWF